MNENRIFANIQKHIRLSDFEKEHFLSLIRTKFIARKDFLVNQNQKCRSIFFVETGSLRAFHIDDNGKESTIMFAIRDWWITDMNSFVNQEEALFSIEALEKSVVLELDFNLLETLYIEIPKFERFFRILMQNAYIREQLRSIQNLSHTAEERYDKFIHKYPAILPHITQKQLASYLGITPEFLSMLRAKKLQS